MTRVRIYYGKETQLIDCPLPHTVKVVMTLVEPYHDKGYDLYLDRFYGSPLLATELGKVGITVTGTVQSNRKGLPKDIVQKQKDPVGTVRAARKRRDCMVCSNREEGGTRHLTLYTCGTCSEKPALQNI